jgi:P-type E1-E2 ATPase
MLWPGGLMLCFGTDLRWLQVIKNTELVVGDVYLINMGDKVVADGVMIDGFHLIIDEASLTGDCLSQPMIEQL